jgi:AcrR family transcriptional regulator
MASTQSTAAGLSRSARRRAQTSARMVEAARVLFAQKGVDGTAISEITDTADVGFGSFYNHFNSKEELAEALLTEAIDEQGAAVDELTRGIEDPAEVLAIAHRYFAGRARTDPDWAWMLVRMDVSHRVMARALGERARRDLRRGIEAGRFYVPAPAVALADLGGALLAVMRSILEGNLPRGAEIHHAEGMLRLLGLDAEDAAEVARRPMRRRASQRR